MFCSSWFASNGTGYCSEDCKNKTCNTGRVRNDFLFTDRIKKKKKLSKLERLALKKEKKINKRINLLKLREKEIKENFYESRAWRTLRYFILKKYGRVCMCCGNTEGRMHVDHIKSRSTHPHLELDENNLQVLCEDCNLGKGNMDDTDFRITRNRPQNFIATQ